MQQDFSRKTANSRRSSFAVVERRPWTFTVSSDKSTEGPWLRKYPQDANGRASLGLSKHFFIVKFKYVCAKDITKHPFVIYEAPFQAEFQEQFTKIREQARMKDEEVEGGWYLEERMEKDLKYSKCLGFFHLFIFFRIDHLKLYYFKRSFNSNILWTCWTAS